MKSREIYRYTVECIARSVSKIEKGTSSRQDIDDLDRWISSLTKFRERDYAVLKLSREEVGHTLMLAQMVRFRIDRLHPAVYLQAKVIRD